MAIGVVELHIERQYRKSCGALTQNRGISTSTSGHKMTTSPGESALMNVRSFVTMSTDLALIEKIEILLSLGSTVQ